MMAGGCRRCFWCVDRCRSVFICFAVMKVEVTALGVYCTLARQLLETCPVNLLKHNDAFTYCSQLPTLTIMARRPTPNPNDAHLQDLRAILHHSPGRVWYLAHRALSKREHHHLVTPLPASKCLIRPILYFNDNIDSFKAAVGGREAGGGDIRLQDEWDEREMANLRQAGSRQAEAQAAAEIRLWGCETDAAGAPTGAASSSAGHVGRAATATGGGAAGGGAAGGERVAGVDADNARFVPFEPACDENWQVCVVLLCC